MFINEWSKQRSQPQVGLLFTYSNILCKSHIIIRRLPSETTKKTIQHLGVNKTVQWSKIVPDDGHFVLWQQGRCRLTRAFQEKRSCSLERNISTSWKEFSGVDWKRFNVIKERILVKKYVGVDKGSLFKCIIVMYIKTRSN